MVVEVVSPKGRRRDFVQKPFDYVEAGIPEYRIVDPREESITVLTLEGDAYTEHGVFGRGGTQPCQCCKASKSKWVPPSTRKAYAPGG